MTKIKKVNELCNEQDVRGDLLLEMATIGEITLHYVVMIRSNDGGNIAHFHVLDKETLGKKFNSAIFITDNRYFKHGNAKDELSSELREALVRFLNQTDEDGESNWVFLVKTWNRNNSTIFVSNDVKRNKPDYSVIKQYK